MLNVIYLYVEYIYIYKQCSPKFPGRGSVGAGKRTVGACGGYPHILGKFEGGGGRRASRSEKL